MNKTILLFMILVFTVIGLMSCTESQQNSTVEDAVSNADVKILQAWQGIKAIKLRDNKIVID